MPVSYSDFNESFGQIWVLFVSVVAAGGDRTASFYLFDLFILICSVRLRQFMCGDGTRDDTIRLTMPRPYYHHRPSTWSAFVIHFVIPMTFLIIVSNFEVEQIPALSSFLTKRLLIGVAGVGGVDESAVTSTTYDTNEEKNGVAVSSTKTKEESGLKSQTSSSTSQYQRETDAAIARGRAKRSQPKQQQNTNTVKVPNAPQQTEMYKQMEDNIERLRSVYERTKRQNDDEDDNDDDWPNTYVVSAIQYADYLRHRDTTIHDGGTYQMTAIDVYTSAIQTLERIRRQAIANGKDVRYPDDTSSSSSSSSSIISLLPQSFFSSSYNGLNRELFLDVDTKSIDGALCAAYTGLGKVYFMSNMFTLAVSSYDRCLLLYDNTYLDSLTYRAQALLILGKYDDAGRDYIHVLRTDTERLFVDAITGLAKILVAKDDAVPGGWDYLIELLNMEIPHQTNAYKKAVSSSSTNANAAGQIVKHHADALKRMHHAMFVYHDVKTMNASMAWKHLSKGNKYKLSTIPPFNVNVERERIARTKAVFRKSFFPSGIGSQTRAPIFIIGFVRSGSTLLERILDAHPLIVGTGEDSVFNGRLDYIRNEIVQASVSGDLRVLHETVTRLGDDVVADMKSRWETIDAVTSERENGDVDDDIIDRPYPTRFADKMLTNYNNVGFIHLLFPNALILHVARQPMDTLLSAYKHDFPPGGLDYTSDFVGLAELYHSYRDVMQHWDTVLPGRVTHVRYEDMVTDLPTIAPGIIKAAGVPWDPTVLDFHKKKQAVNTLSTTQVRKGLYSHHFESWKRYEQFLGPLIELVGSEVKYDLKTTLPTVMALSSVGTVIDNGDEFLSIGIPQVVVLIRHGEKDASDDLNKRGRERAKCLANHFKNASFTHLFAFIDKRTHRPVETITPLSEMTGVLIDTSFDRDDVQGLVKHISELPESSKVLICWEHSYLKKIAERLGVKKVHKYKSDEYDLQWTVQNGLLASTHEHC